MSEAGTFDPLFEHYVVEACSRLIRFDTSNFGGGDSRGERDAAEWVAGELESAGLTPEVIESAPRRASVVARVEGSDASLPALLVHGHLDVVPAEAGDWSVSPFSGEIRGGEIFGRGALDMKGMDAMMLASVRALREQGRTPPRDVVVAFVADEEDTGRFGAGYLVEERPELFEGVETAIGESGATLTRLPDGGHLYGIAAGERGTAWMNLVAHGRAGHGSRPNSENAVVTIAETVRELAAVEWPVRLSGTVERLLCSLADRLGVDVDPSVPDELAKLGEARRLVDSTLRNSLTPTMLQAGYKANVVPSEATATVDGRVLPGFEEEFFATVDSLLPPTVSRTFESYQAPVFSDPDSGELAAMAAALRLLDPDALVLPFVMAGGTDAKSFSRLGIACYGFTPGRYPPGFPADSYVHGVDERVPVDSVQFGAEVLHAYLCQPPTVPRRAKETP